jgi:hypothetical protein
MDERKYLRKAKREGYATIEDYIKANLNYLPKEKRELFCNLTGYKPQEANEKKYSGGEYNGKN